MNEQWEQKRLLYHVLWILVQPNKTKVQNGLSSKPPWVPSLSFYKGCPVSKVHITRTQNHVFLTPSSRENAEKGANVRNKEILWKKSSRTEPQTNGPVVCLKGEKVSQKLLNRKLIQYLVPLKTLHKSFWQTIQAIAGEGKH